MQQGRRIAEPNPLDPLDPAFLCQIPKQLGRLVTPSRLSFRHQRGIMQVLEANGNDFMTWPNEGTPEPYETEEAERKQVRFQLKSNFPSESY